MWIKVKDGTLPMILNLNFVEKIYKASQFNKYRIIFEVHGNNILWEFSSEEERDRRYENIAKGLCSE